VIDPTLSSPSPPSSHPPLSSSRLIPHHPPAIRLITLDFGSTRKIERLDTPSARDNGWTDPIAQSIIRPLHDASFAETVRLLLDRGVNADAETMDGRPITRSVIEGKNGDHGLTTRPGAEGRCTDKEGRTPLESGQDGM